MKGETKKMNVLYQLLYLAAKNCVAERFQEDAEEIKALRDSYTDLLFQRNYKELTETELGVVIDILYQKTGKIVSDKASKNQLKLLRFYQFQCAIVYCEWDKLMLNYKESERQPGRIVTGDEARQVIRELIDSNIKIPLNVFKWMFESWINPTSHKFLIEAGLKTMVKNKHNFHYEYLNPAEANCLIQRFGQFYMTLNKTGKLNNVDLSGSLN